MRGAVLHEVGGSLHITTDLELASVGSDEVRVRLRASGVCHSDLSFQNGTFPLPSLPAVLGHEGAGEVIEVGDRVAQPSVGDHVILAWVPPCGHCYLCRAGQPFLCQSGQSSEHGRITSPEGDVHAGFGVGAFADEVVVPAIAAVPIERDVPFEIAALVGCGVMTGVGAAINTASVQRGASVLVIGCGGVGVNVVQGARAAGAGTIVAVDRVPGKRSAALRFGATDCCAPHELPDMTDRSTEGHGFDVAFEVVGRSETIRMAWDATRRGGRTVIVGAGSHSDLVEFSANELFSPGKTLTGCRYGSADVRTDFGRILGMWRAGRLDLENLISRKLGLEQVDEAFAAMEAGDELRSVICF